MSSKKWPQTETDLAEPVIAYLEDMKWEVYQEVEPKRYGDVADIVAVQNGRVWVIELKKTLSLEVIAQADEWRPVAHYVSIATPVSYRRRITKGARLAEHILCWKGIGWFKVAEPIKGWYESEFARQKRVPSLNRKALAYKILDSLCEEQKTFAKAGNAEGKRWTPFQNTCKQVLATVAHSPGICMKDLVDAISHHYASDAGARANLSQWIQAGVVKGVEARKEGRYLRIYPEGEENGR